MSIAEFITVLPCRSGCATNAADEDDRVPMPGVHGGYCERCYGLMENALSVAAPLVMHLLNQVGGLRSKPSSGGEKRTKAVSAPMPMNVSAFDDANEVFRILAGWSHLLGGPKPSQGTWQDRAGNVVGLPFGIGVLSARQDTAVLANWMKHRLEDILHDAEDDQVVRLKVDLARIRRLNLAWPTEDKPSFSRKAVCADDGEPLLIVPPREPGADRGIVCSNCGRHYTEDEHDQYGRYLKAVAKEAQKRAKTG